jgi:FkbM family methyltransferase
MKTLSEALAGEFVIVNLGAAEDRDLAMPPHIRSATTLVEIDANEAAQTNASYFAHHKLKSVIAGTKGERTFRQNAYSFCSSVLDPNENLVNMYQLQEYFKPVSRTKVECETLPEVLRSHEISSIDFLKTDLEGIDFEVIQSCQEMLPHMLAVKCELRFQPIFQGEPYFHECSSYLTAHGFELIDLKPEFWKPATTHWKDHSDGRVVWANCLFMKKPEAIASTVSQAKQILIASMEDRRCYAEYLFERWQDNLPREWQADLEKLVMPVPPTFRDTAPWKILRYVRDTLWPRPRLTHIAER